MIVRKQRQEGTVDKRQASLMYPSPTSAPMRHYVTINSDLLQYNGVTKKLVALARHHGFDNYELFAMALAIDEALVNAIKHGNGCDASKRISIEYAVDVSEVYVKIVDEGGGFDTEALLDPLLPENQTRDSGRGVYLMRSLMTEVAYNATGNQVEMWKSRTIAPPLKWNQPTEIATEKTMRKKRLAVAAPPHVLLAEDDKEMRVLLAHALRRAGYFVIECSNGMELLDHLGSYILPGEEHEQVDLVISDIRMPGLTGLEILEGVSKHDDFPPFFLITAFGDAEAHAQAEKFGAKAMFDKPFDIDDLLAKMRRVVPLAKDRESVQ